MQSWKARVNKALSATTGYHLARRAEPVPKRPAERAARVRRKPAQKRPSFPVDFAEDYREIIRAVRPYTMTGNEKLHALITAARYVHRNKVPGAIVECGVWRGGSMHAVARTLDAEGDHARDLYLFDTFEGMTEPTEKDERFDDKTAEHLLATSARESNMWAHASLEDVRQAFEQVPYPSDRVHYVKGPVEETVPDRAPEQIAILRLDTDWYESTKHELDRLYPRLVSGGVLMIDDYGWWKGSRTATDEFLDETGEPLYLVRMATGRVAVKP